MGSKSNYIEQPELSRLGGLMRVLQRYLLQYKFISQRAIHKAIEYSLCYVVSCSLLILNNALEWPVVSLTL